MIERLNPLAINIEEVPEVVLTKTVTTQDFNLAKAEMLKKLDTSNKRIQILTKDLRRLKIIVGLLAICEIIAIVLLAVCS